MQSEKLSVSPERHVAVRVKDAVEPRPTRDGGCGRGRRRLPSHREQRRSLRHLHLLLILGIFLSRLSDFLSGSTWIRFCSPFSSASVGGASLDMESFSIHTSYMYIN